jgi:hypothetical protein
VNFSNYPWTATQWAGCHEADLDRVDLASDHADSASDQADLASEQADLASEQVEESTELGTSAEVADRAVHHGQDNIHCLHRTRIQPRNPESRQDSMEILLSHKRRTTGWARLTLSMS